MTSDVCDQAHQSLIIPGLANFKVLSLYKQRLGNCFAAHLERRKDVTHQSCKQLKQYLAPRQNAVAFAAVQICCKRCSQKPWGEQIGLDTVSNVSHTREGEGWLVFWGKPPVTRHCPVCIDEHNPSLRKHKLSYCNIGPTSKKSQLISQRTSRSLAKPWTGGGRILTRPQTSKRLPGNALMSAEI